MKSSMAERMASGLANDSFGSSGDLARRIWFVLLMLIIYRVGTYIPLPGVNLLALDEVAKAQAGGILGMFNTFTGGALGRMSIFTLNIMPYITASIIMQLMTVISKELGNLKKEGDAGRKKITQITRYVTVALALVQGYGIAVGIEGMSSSYGGVVLHPGFNFRLISVISLLGGTVFVMWISEQITTQGIGNGSSLIIFTGIVSGLPSLLAMVFEMGRTGALSTAFILVVLLAAVALIYFVVFMERAQRRVLVQYPKRQVGNKVYGGDSTHLPLKINTAGVIPPIFASALLLFPATIIGFSQNLEAGYWQQIVSMYLSHGKPLYIFLYFLLICFFSFFYTSVIFNPDETAENLRKNGGVVLGRRPGKHTSEYLDYILTRITVLGAAYISVVCILPEIIIEEYSLPFYLGGTSLLIVVNVVMDMFSQIQTHLLSSRYEHLFRKAKLKRGR